MASRPFRGTNLFLAAGLAVFAGAGLLMPFFYSRAQRQPLATQEAPLGPQAVQRGPYLNVGSRDIGRDPTPMEEYKKASEKRKQLMQGGSGNEKSHT